MFQSMIKSRQIILSPNNIDAIDYENIVSDVSSSPEEEIIFPDDWVPVSDVCFYGDQTVIFVQVEGPAPEIQIDSHILTDNAVNFLAGIVPSYIPMTTSQPLLAISIRPKKTRNFVRSHSIQNHHLEKLIAETYLSSCTITAFGSTARFHAEDGDRCCIPQTTIKESTTTTIMLYVLV